MSLRTQIPAGLDIIPIPH